MLFSFEGSNEEKWLCKTRKRLYSEMQGNIIWGGGVCENPVGLSMYDGPMGTVDKHLREYLVHARLGY